MINDLKSTGDSCRAPATGDIVCCSPPCLERHIYWDVYVFVRKHATLVGLYIQFKKFLSCLHFIVVANAKQNIKKKKKKPQIFYVLFCTLNIKFGVN